MSSEHHPADARRRAEEWLTRYDDAVPSIPPGSADTPEVRLLRALLAASTPAAGEREEKALQISGMHDSCDWCQREIPDGCYGVLCSECDTKAHDALDTAQPQRPAQVEEGPAALKLRHLVYVYGCGDRPGHGPEDCSWCEAAALLAGVKWDEEPPPPAQDAVREAAEVVRTILTAHDARLSESGVLTYGPPSKGTGFVAAIQWLRRYDAARGGE